jgi:long-chain fatty acid transport protein
MKQNKILLSLLLGSLLIMPAWAGGLMTNTNYHIAFDRMMARGTTFDIDAIYSNPAGLAWGHEGWQVSFNVQKPFQYRNIEAAVPAALAPAMGFTNHEFKGKATANPFVPALFGSYKHEKWAIGFMAGIVGSGGKVTYDEGVPQFVIPVRAMMATNGLTPNLYSLDAYMQGKQYIYGVQANFTYRLTDHWAVAAGLRGNIYSGFNRGHVISNAGGAELLNMQIDVDQKGFGMAPLLSLNYRWKGLTLTGRYEFRTKLNIPNDTKVLSVSPATVAATVAPMAAAYQDGVKTRYDMPGLLSVAAGYEFVPEKFRGTLEYHWFDDKHAKMQGNRQDALTHGTQEILVGLEYDINKTFTVSCGGQRTDYGLDDQYQTNTSFACDSYSVGLGGAVNITNHLRINLGYFCSIYSDYSRQTTYMTIPVGETYSRTNHVFGVGVDYKF